MSSPIADGVMAATHRLVQQAMKGQWSEIPRTLEERRVLLDRLSAGAAAKDQPWLNALRQAMAESDAVVAKIREAAPPEPVTPQVQAKDSGASLADSMMDMIRRSR